MSEGVDTAIYEVGVGGQYDSTNIIDAPTGSWYFEFGYRPYVYVGQYN